jgi:nucleoside-diphosphate-sugar epimerase
VGTAVCKAAASRGLSVKSLSRSGAPHSPVPGVEYVRGDVFDTTWTANLAGCTAVISCIGGFGNNEQMRRINGTANEVAIAAAAAAAVPRFVFVSVHEYNIPAFITDAIGYFQGKRSAERALLAAFPDTGVALQPGFIYGDRAVGESVIPLGMVGKPLEQVLGGGLGKVLKPLSALPFSDVLLAPPVSVEAVAEAAVKSALAEGTAVRRTLDIQAINELAQAREV